jgi:hypothetical protein
MMAPWCWRANTEAMSIVFIFFLNLIVLLLLVLAVFL